MNLDTLIEILTDYRDELGGEAEVRLMPQQQWPFENRICGLTSGQEMNVSAQQLQVVGVSDPAGHAGASW